MRLAGHTLRSEGAAYVVNVVGEIVRVQQGVGGRGRAWCSCDVMSPMLLSGRARRVWHFEHKVAARDGAQ